jgi:hypothetical protein
MICIKYDLFFDRNHGLTIPGPNGRNHFVVIRNGISVNAGAYPPPATWKEHRWMTFAIHQTRLLWQTGTLINAVSRFVRQILARNARAATDVGF